MERAIVLFCRLYGDSLWSKLLGVIPWVGAGLLRLFVGDKNCR